MALAALATDTNIATFLLLLMRLAGLVAFFPFFENNLIPISIRSALVFFFALVLFPLTPAVEVAAMPTITHILLLGLLELLMGFIAGLALRMVFESLNFGGELISFSMGLTMASAFDPVSGAQKPIVLQVLVLLALLLALAFDFHHTMLQIFAESLNAVPLGGFVYENEKMLYFVKAFINLLVVGFSLAFPILALILLSDIIFGMIMKTHSQFNLLSIGFPIKIIIAFVALVLILPSIMLRFRNELESALKSVLSLMGG